MTGMTLTDQEMLDAIEYESAHERFLIEAFRAYYDDLVQHQEDLGEPFSTVLYENLDKLYES
jgi:hypothetical protein